MRRWRVERERQLREAIWRLHVFGRTGRYWSRRLAYLRGKLRRELEREPPMLFIAYDPDTPERVEARRYFNEILKIFVGDHILRASYMQGLELLGYDVGEIKHGSYAAAQAHRALLEEKD